MYICEVYNTTCMRCFRFILLFILMIPVFFSCNKDLNVNAEWKDITVVYGLLDQTADTTFIKITKAFLGPGDAMQFAKIPDSSNYPDKLEVRLAEYNNTDSLTSYLCDTITVHNKKKGDSIFYYPDQLMYYTKVKLDENHNYKLNIRNTKTGKVITGHTELIQHFEIFRPQVTISFNSGLPTEVEWSPAKNGKRYQIIVRFYYQEWMGSGDTTTKYIDWTVRNNILTLDPTSTQHFHEYISGDGFYTFVGSKIDTSSIIKRNADRCAIIFSVATADLNTYMEVTEPSTTIVQEKPPFTNIENGIGLFAARFTKIQDSLSFSNQTKAALKTNIHTMNRGF
jgi:hypothetical protein